MPTVDSGSTHSPSIGEHEHNLKVLTSTAEFFAVSAGARFAPPISLCTRLLEAVEAAGAESAESMEVLRATVHDFSVNLRRQGATPEAMLISLKTLIRDQTFRGAASAGSYIYGDPMRQSISTWAIEEFFKDQTD